MLGVAVYYLVLLGVCVLVANIQRHSKSADRCEFCDDNVDKTPHLGMCVECYEFYHVDG